MEQCPVVTVLLVRPVLLAEWARADQLPYSVWGTVSCFLLTSVTGSALLSYYCPLLSRAFHWPVWLGQPSYHIIVLYCLEILLTSVTGSALLSYYCPLLSWNFIDQCDWVSPLIILLSSTVLKFYWPVWLGQPSYHIIVLYCLEILLTSVTGSALLSYYCPLLSWNFIDQCDWVSPLIILLSSTVLKCHDVLWLIWTVSFVSMP